MKLFLGNKAERWTMWCWQLFCWGGGYLNQPKNEYKYKNSVMKTDLFTLLTSILSFHKVERLPAWYNVLLHTSSKCQQKKDGCNQCFFLANDHTEFRHSGAEKMSSRSSGDSRTPEQQPGRNSWVQSNWYEMCKAPCLPPLPFLLHQELFMSTEYL